MARVSPGVSSLSNLVSTTEEALTGLRQGGSREESTMERTGQEGDREGWG